MAQSFAEGLLLLLEPPQLALDLAHLRLLGRVARDHDLQQRTHRLLLFLQLVQSPGDPLLRLPHRLPPRLLLTVLQCLPFSFPLLPDSLGSECNLRREGGFFRDEVVLALATAVAAEETLGGLVLGAELLEEEVLFGEFDQHPRLPHTRPLGVPGQQEDQPVALPRAQQLRLLPRQPAHRKQLIQIQHPPPPGRRYLRHQLAHLLLQSRLPEEKPVDRTLAGLQGEDEAVLALLLAGHPLLETPHLSLECPVGELKSLDPTGVAVGELAVVLLHVAEVKGERGRVLKHLLELLAGEESGHCLAAVHFPSQVHLPTAGSVLAVVEAGPLSSSGGETVELLLLRLREH